MVKLSPRWLEYGLVIASAWVVSGMFVPLSVPLVQPEQSQVATPAKPETVSDHFKTVPLFGKVKTQAETKSTPKPVAVVASKLNIKLVGTVVAGDKSAAMVSVNDGKKQRVFFLREDIQPGVRLEKVEPEAIVVDNHGKMERIAIEKGKAIAAAPTNTIANTAKPAIRRPVLPTSSRRIDRGRLQKQMRNFSTLLSQARVTPHFNNGKPDGFMISEIVKGSLYEEIGLQNGDIIQKVNGETVTGAEQAMRMYRELQSATFIDVEVVRNGVVQQLSYVIQ